MKTILKSIIILIAILQSTLAAAQFNAGPGLLYGRTDASMQKIGIGNFSVNADVQGKLHVNHFLLNTNTATDGFLFRTDGDQDTDNRWQLFTGSDASSQTERFRVRTLAGGYDTYLERTHSGSEADVRLLTAEVQIRARGKRLGDFCELAGGLADEVTMGDGTDVNFTALSSTNKRLFLHGSNGFLGVGSKFSESVLQPNYQLHLNHDDPESGTDEVFQQFTTGTSGQGAADGLRIGMSGLDSEIKSYESGALRLSQANQLRMIIKGLDWGGHNTYPGYTNGNRIVIPTENYEWQDDRIFSLLNLGYGSHHASMYRPWMNVGMTMSASYDIMYVGLLQKPKTNIDGSVTDAVVAWGKNGPDHNPNQGPDNLRFLFLINTTKSGPAASSQGRETMRITPMGEVGIGDFSHMPGGLNEQPTHRLDVNGNARLRQLLSGDSQVLITGKQQNQAGDYELRYLSFPGTGQSSQYLAGDGTWQPFSQSSCSLTPNSTSQNNSINLSMAYNNHCAQGGLGIGIQYPWSRLHVVGETNNTAARVVATGGTGLAARATGGNGSINTGVSGYGSFANSTSSAVGVLAEAFVHSSCEQLTNAYAYGLKAYANNARINYAVFGEAIPHLALNMPNPPPHCTAYGTSWAGYFNGAVHSTAGLFTTSDENLKTNIQIVQNAGSLLSQIQISSYEFNHDAFQGMFLPGGQHWGVLAQQLETVLPDLVTTVFHPAKYDSTGTMITPEYEFKAVNYTELTPILIAGHQEQQVTIDALKAEIEAMKAQMAECCAKATDKSSTGSNSTGSFTEPADFDLQIEKATLDQNVPNPFNTETSITYRIPAQAQVRLRILGQSGQQIDTLVDGLMPKGEYKIIWNASHLPAGMYYYTLEADGVELVKKAVKL